MIGQIIFTIVAFVLFVYILLLKLIKKNDTTYLIILGLQAIGILINLLKITFGIFKRYCVYVCTIFFMYNITNSGVCVRNEKYKCFRNSKNFFSTNLHMVT